MFMKNTFLKQKQAKYYHCGFLEEVTKSIFSNCFDLMTWGLTGIITDSHVPLATPIEPPVHRIINRIDWNRPTTQALHYLTIESQKEEEKNSSFSVNF